jgi:putative membrane protein
MALGLWLAGLGAFMVLPGAWPAARRRWWRGPLWALAAAAAVVVAGGLLMTGGLGVLVGVEIANVGLLLGFVALSAAAFVATLQALVVLFGARGWLAGLLLAGLQAAAAGFPYPPETLPGPVAALHPFLPMTHAVEAMRASISGGGSAVGLDAAVLVAWLVMALLVTLAASAGAAGAAGRDKEAMVATAR